MRLNALLIVAIFVVTLLAYYTLSPSYSSSKDAKTLFDEGRYEEALEAAEKTYQANQYNMMAYSIVEQSKIAIRHKK
ncbi:MAG: hypothetical protein LBN32_00795, partial [Helicobacteraceae bacterium]|nr:hypothetical protein [Helicobacteraceae bacterium]